MGTRIFNIRPVEEKDLSLLANHRNQENTYGNLTSSLPVWPHYQKSWLQGLGERNMYFMINVTEFSLKEVGILRLTDIDWQNSNAAIGLDIFSRFRGMGYGKEAFKFAVDHFFLRFNFHRLWLLVSGENIPAQKIYTNAGFKEEGIMRNQLFKNGKYVDYIMMGILREEWASSIQT